jgi:hypothetical protein
MSKKKDIFDNFTKEQLEEQHESVDFDNLIEPALHFDVKAYNQQRKEHKRLRNEKKKI